MQEKLETSSNKHPGVLVKSLQRYHGKNEQNPCSPLSQNYRYVCVSFLEKGVFVLLFTQVFRILSSCPWNHGRTRSNQHATRGETAAAIPAPETRRRKGWDDGMTRNWDVTLW